MPDRLAHVGARLPRGRWTARRPLGRTAARPAPPRAPPSTRRPRRAARASAGARLVDPSAPTVLELGHDAITLEVHGPPFYPAGIARTKDSVTIDAAGTEVVVSSPSKVFFSSRGETKLDLVEYYLAVQEPLMRWLGGRAVLMERFPDGASRQELLPEAGAQGDAAVAADHRGVDAERHDQRGARRSRHRPRDLGGQPGLPRLARLAVARRRRRPRRRAPHRSRPPARRRCSTRSGRPPPRPVPSSPSWDWPPT